METEKIKFEFWFTSEYWNNPPLFDIYINDKKINTYTASTPELYVSFTEQLDFVKHKLKIVRYGKTDSETDSNGNTQVLVLNKVKIDDINIQNLVWHYSKFYPDYSTSYASENLDLETEVTGEMFFGHNGTWEYCFTSPFYYDVVNKVRGNDV